MSSLARPLMVMLLLAAGAHESAAARRTAQQRPASRRGTTARPPRQARRTSATTLGRRSVLPRLRVDYSLARFGPRSILSGSAIGVGGPVDPDNPRIEASMYASAETGWRYQIRFRGTDFDVPPRRMSRPRRLELESALRREVVKSPALAEPLAYLIADLPIKQPPLASPIALDSFTMVSADSLRGEGSSVRAFRFRGMDGDRLLEFEMAFDESGRSAVRVRRWKPDGNLLDLSRGRARELEPGELEALQRILGRRAREPGRSAFDPSAVAAVVLKERREARAADH